MVRVYFTNRTAPKSSTRHPLDIIKRCNKPPSPLHRNTRRTQVYVNLREPQFHKHLWLSCRLVASKMSKLTKMKLTTYNVDDVESVISMGKGIVSYYGGNGEGLRTAEQRRGTGQARKGKLWQRISEILHSSVE
ncbi:hypothetical protein J6590_016036 [Homalodisca vitripennis]|nr:hypothetical protein J6590_016036 [Homalodisca vitripennis]